MDFYAVNPLLDKRWVDFVAGHPRTSVFHQRGWLEALALTYGYQPYVLSSTGAGKALVDGIPLCRVGSRLVSLPFSDHCDLLVSDGQEPRDLLDHLRLEVERKRFRYVELRSLSDNDVTMQGMGASQRYWFHELDVTPGLDILFRRLHRNSFQRKIRRAERERLTYEVGVSNPLVDEFYRLLLLTRRRHRLIPQPRQWFRNLVRCMGSQVQIRLARKDGVPIAAVLTIRHGETLVYKYGCSDATFHRLGGVPYLFWKMVEEGKACGIARIDFGRCETDNPGLIEFKDRFGTKRKLITYYRYKNKRTTELVKGWQMPDFQQFIRHHGAGLFVGMPDLVLSMAGRILYKHLG